MSQWNCEVEKEAPRVMGASVSRMETAASESVCTQRRVDREVGGSEDNGRGRGRGPLRDEGERGPMVLQCQKRHLINWLVECMKVSRVTTVQQGTARAQISVTTAGACVNTFFRNNPSTKFFGTKVSF